MMKRLLLVLGMALLFPVVAWGAAYTVAGPILINDAGTGVVGTVNAVSVASGVFTSAGTFLDAGTQDILFVQIALTAGAIDQVGISGNGSSALGGGFLAGSGTQDPNDPDEPIIDFLGSQALFNFDHLGGGTGNLSAGESSSILAVSFALGDLPPPGIGPGHILADIANFMLSSGTTFSVSGLVVPVPEPGSFLLIGLGMAALAGMRRV